MKDVTSSKDDNLVKNPIAKISKNVWILTATSFLTDISSEMLINLIPLFLANVLGASTSIIGLIEGVAESTASIMKVFSGALSDKIGKRKGLAVIGYGLSALAKPFLYFSTTWIWVLAVRFSDRLGKGIRTAPRDALLAGSVTDERRGLAFGVQRAGDTAGAMLGMIIAALIIWKTQANAELLSANTFHIIVLASIIPAVLAVLVLAFGANEIQQKSKTNLPFLSLKGMDNRFKAFLAVSILFTLGNSSDAFIILRGQERGLSTLQIMGMLITFNFVYSVLSTPAGALSDRIGRGRLILGGWITYALIYLGFALSKTGTEIWLVFGLYGVFYALTEGAGKAFIADLVPAEKRGTAYGLYHAAVGLSAFPASVIAGLLWQGAGSWQGFGPSAPFYFGAAMALVAGILFLILVRPVKQNQT
jgi:MFS family permease